MEAFEEAVAEAVAELGLGSRCASRRVHEKLI